MKKRGFVFVLVGFLSMPLWATTEEGATNKVHFKTILTLRDFVSMVMFPEWDTVVRVDVGNKNLLGAEASKDYPNFVILFQKGPSPEPKKPLRTNATVILKSGHVFHFLITSLDTEKARPEKVPLLYNFTGEYTDGAGVKTVALDKPAPAISERDSAILARLAHLEDTFVRAVEARADTKAKERLFDGMDTDPTTVLKKESAHGLELVLHEIRPLDGLRVIRFSVVNRGSTAVDLMEPQITLETMKGAKTLRARTVPVERLRLSATKIEAKGAVRGVLAFPADAERDANQVFKLSVARKDAADQPVKVTLY